MEEQVKEKSKIEERADLIANLKKNYQDIEDMNIAENLIKSNKMDFLFDNVKYRLRKPTFEERQETDAKRMEKYLELLKNKNYMFRKQWIQLYKERGIDLEQIEKDIDELQKDQEKVLLQLAVATDAPTINELKIQILNLRDQILEKAADKAEKLQYSIEERLNELVYSYLAFKALEIIENDTVRPAFTEYSQFLEAKSGLVKLAIEYLMTLIYADPS